MPVNSLRLSLAQFIESNSPTGGGRRLKVTQVNFDGDLAVNSKLSYLDGGLEILIIWISINWLKRSLGSFLIKTEP